MADENLYTFENPDYKKTYWHTCSHVLAQAMKRLHPEVKLAIGPSIENGFYYDFDTPAPFTEAQLGELEAEMRKICKEKLKLERFELPRAEAVKFMEEKGEPYKVELINDLPQDATISFYKQGEFTDLCAGPHLDSTGRIKGNGIKLTACNAAYWRGDSNRQTLQRIYGIAFPKKDELDAYLKQQEEALKRDHNKLAGSWSSSPPWTSSARACPSCCPRGPRSSRSSSGGLRTRRPAGAISSPRPPSWPSGTCTASPATGTNYLDGMFVLGDPEGRDQGVLRPAAHDLPLPVPGVLKPRPVLPGPAHAPGGDLYLVPQRGLR